MQARYAPEKQRLMQMDACEMLLRIIRPGSAYPFEFICFHITGYRPKSELSAKPLDYKTLIADLAAYVANLSRSMSISSDDLKQRFYTVEDLAKRFKVCSKTIARWRTDGLIGRYLTFPDGRKRLAFSSATVSHFVKTHSKRVQNSSRFTKLAAQERQRILGRLLRWAERLPEYRQEAIVRTAQRFGRATETVRGILADYERKTTDEKCPFVKRSEIIAPPLRHKIYELHKAGEPIEQIAASLNRSRSNIYRAITIEQAARLGAITIKFMPSDEFAKPGANAEILHGEQMAAISRTKVPATKTTSAGPGTLGALAVYVNEISHIPVLKPAQEAAAFRKYNYLKYLAAAIQSRLDSNSPQVAIMRRLEAYLAEAETVKELLIRSNLRLVLSVARKHTHNDTQMLDFISEGNLTLLNAVEKFDYSRGFRFSTYATWAIVRRFATFQTAKSKQLEYAAEDELLELSNNLRISDSRITAIESARRGIEEVMAAELDNREKTIVREHYGLSSDKKVPGQRKPKSLSQIAALLGLSKERIRQIELVALGKLRHAVSGEQFDLLVSSS